MKIKSKNILMGFLVGGLIGLITAAVMSSLDAGLIAGFFCASATMVSTAKYDEKKRNEK